MTALRTAPAKVGPTAAAVDAGAELREAMRRYVTGVTVVTTVDETGSMTGLTANSFTSVSLEPPLVLVCLSHSARSCAAFLRSGSIAIHILADDQHDIARGFARRGGDRQSVCPWRVNKRGYAILERYLAVLECRISDVHTAGDHAIVVARVISLDTAGTGKSPLVFHDGRMFGLAPPPV